jgi:hypothetical protein
MATGGYNKLSKIVFLATINHETIRETASASGRRIFAGRPELAILAGNAPGHCRWRGRRMTSDDSAFLGGRF